MLRIRDVYPGSKFFSSWIQGQKNSGSRIRISCNPKNLFPSAQKYDPWCSSRIRIPDLNWIHKDPISHSWQGMLCYKSEKYGTFPKKCQRISAKNRVADLYHFNADPDPTFYFNSDPHQAFITYMRIRIQPFFKVIRICNIWSIGPLRLHLVLLNLLNVDFNAVRIQLFTLMRIRIQLLIMDDI